MLSRKRTWIDISATLKTGMVHWPGDPPVRIERIHDIARGDAMNLSALTVGSHTGTHMDAPLHFMKNGTGLDALSLDATIGAARVIEIRHLGSVAAEELTLYDIREGERILLKTENSVRCWNSDSFVEDFAYLSAEAARFLVERRIRTVGIDYLSVGGYQKDREEAHRLLLKGGVWINEGLDLSRTAPGIYELICLPLKILNSDGAPARAVLGKK